MAKFLLMVVAALVAVVVDTSAKPQGGEGSAIVFSDSSSNVTSRYRMPIALPGLRTTENPRCSTGRGPGQGEPCVEDADYNDNVKEYVNFLIRQNNLLKGLVENPVLSNILNDSPAPVLPLDGPATRIGGVKESPVCHAQETIIYPKRGKTPKSEWVFVVNQEGVEQALRVEQCLNDGSPCNFGMPLQGSATATCRQKYVYRRLLTVGSNAIQPEEVLMPSCCVCYLSSDGFDVLTRIKNSTSGQPGMSPAPPTEQPAAPPPAPIDPEIPTSTNVRVNTHPTHPVHFPGFSGMPSGPHANFRSFDTRRTMRNG